MNMGNLDSNLNFKRWLFVVGFPKSGTTTICNMLSRDPRICHSIPKEPLYLCSDVYATEKNKLFSESHYKEYFSHSTDSTLIYCDGSTLNVYSSNAIKVISKHFPNAQFLIVEREPVEFVKSWHKQLVSRGKQPILSIEEAWRESSRQQFFFLNYKEMCKQKKYIKIWLENFGANRILVLKYEDIKLDYNHFFNKIYNFIDLAPPATFPLLHSDPSNEPRFIYIRNLLKGIFKSVGVHHALLVYISKNPESFIGKLRDFIFSRKSRYNFNLNSIREEIEIISRDNS